MVSVKSVITLKNLGIIVDFLPNVSKYGFNVAISNQRQRDIVFCFPPISYDRTLNPPESKISVFIALSRKKLSRFFYSSSFYSIFLQKRSKNLTKCSVCIIFLNSYSIRVWRLWRNLVTAFMWTFWSMDLPLYSF